MHGIGDACYGGKKRLHRRPGRSDGPWAGDAERRASALRRRRDLEADDSATSFHSLSLAPDRYSLRKTYYAQNHLVDPRGGESLPSDRPGEPTRSRAAPVLGRAESGDESLLSSANEKATRQPCALDRFCERWDRDGRAARFRFVLRCADVAREYVDEPVRVVEKHPAQDERHLVMRPARTPEGLRSRLADVLEPEVDLSAFYGAPIVLEVPINFEMTIEDPRQQLMAMSPVLPLRIARGIERGIGSETLDRFKQRVEYRPSERRGTDALGKPNTRPWRLGVELERAAYPADGAIDVVPSLVHSSPQRHTTVTADEVQDLVTPGSQRLRHSTLKKPRGDRGRGN
jgi:hypothetical protein